MMARRKSTPQPTEMDVTSPEKQYPIQCESVCLVTSSFQPLDLAKEECKDSRFTFKIRADVDENHAFSQLDTRVVFIPGAENEPPRGYVLQFVLLGVFTASEPTPAEVLTDFARMFTLSILWPYAREYASDQFRRAGEVFDALPIINPQVVTEGLLKNNLIEVRQTSLPA
ncbi:MAG: hypothetical protein PHQ40_03585 [Anaerolineaceae bacterium]|nr:hypothetical protein [Anaerolineaceae bacterium]